MSIYFQEKVEIINGQEVTVQVYPPQGQIPTELMPREGKSFKPNYTFKKPDLVPQSEFCNWNEDAIYC